MQIARVRGSEKLDIRVQGLSASCPSSQSVLQSQYRAALISSVKMARSSCPTSERRAIY
jgi:hypothetical protein